MYLNQKARWCTTKVRAVNNPYGDIVYNEPTVISVRRQEHVEEVRTKDGAVHRTNFMYYTNADVKVDDTLDDYLVVEAYDMRTLGGHNRLRRLKTI